MAKKAIHINQIKLNGVEISDTLNTVNYVRERSSDVLKISQNFFIIEPETDYIQMDINIVETAVLTLFIEDDRDNLSQVKVKLNGNDTEFKIAPIFWSEEAIESIMISNSQNQRRLIYVLQLHAQEIGNA